MLRVGVAHHLGWAILVTVDVDAHVVDRRRIELVDPGLPAAPIHHGGGAHPIHQSGPLRSDAELLELVTQVRDSARRRAADELGRLTDDLGSVASLAVRRWSADFPTDIATLRRPPHEARADARMYCQVLVEAATDRRWVVHHYDHRTVEAAATTAGVELAAPRRQLGPPWTNDHRLALAAAVDS